MADKVYRSMIKVTDGYYGPYVAYLNAAAGTVGYSQDLFVTGYGPHVLSVYSRNRGDYAAGLLAIDGITTGAFYPTAQWDQYCLTGTIPTGIVDVKLIFAATNGQLEVDAVQFSPGTGCGDFGFVSPSATLEFETDPIGIHTFAGLSPFIADEFDVNPIKTEFPRGFITVGDYTEGHEYEPDGKGGFVGAALPTGEFIYYKGTDIYNGLAAFTNAVLEPPVCTGVTHFLSTYNQPTSQRTWMHLCVGEIDTALCEYDTAFTANDGTYYPSGIQHEDWVGPDTKCGRKAILPTGYPQWEEVLRWRINNSLDSGAFNGVFNFDGIMYDGGDIALGIPPYSEVPPAIDSMNNLINNLHTWVETNTGGTKHLGITNSCKVIKDDYNSATGILKTLDAIMIDGLTVPCNYNIRTEFERNEIRTDVCRTLRDAYDYANIDVPVFAHDYMETLPTGDFPVETVDLRVIRESRFYADNEDWMYNWGANGLTGQYMGTYGVQPEQYDYGLYTGLDKVTGIHMGRYYTDWAKLSGHNKLRQRAVFHQYNTGVGEDITSPVNESRPDTIAILSNNSRYKGIADRIPHSYTHSCATFTLGALEFRGLRIGQNTSADGVLYCTAEIDANGVFIFRAYTTAADRTADINRVTALMQGTLLYDDKRTVPENSSGLSILIHCSDTAVTAEEEFEIEFEAPWITYITDDGDDRVVLRRGSNLDLTAVVSDAYGNPMDDEYIYSAALHGTVDPFITTTNNSGRISNIYTPSTGILVVPDNYITGYINFMTGYDLDRISYLARSPEVESHVLVDLVGGININFTGWDVTGCDPLYLSSNLF